jgi:hypothetical protein
MMPVMRAALGLGLPLAEVIHALLHCLWQTKNSDNLSKNLHFPLQTTLA